MTTENNIESLATKIAHIAAKVGKIAKSGTNSGYGESYNFIEYGVVAGKLRDLLDEYKVIIYPEIRSYDCKEVTSVKGKAGYHYLFNMHFTIMNGEKQDDKMECDWLGEATDYGDKGVNKAITAATKYFIMRLLQVSEKGDEDPDSVTPMPRKAEPKKIKGGMDLDEIKTKLSNLKTPDEIRAFYAEYVKVHELSDKQKELLTKVCEDRKNNLDKKSFFKAKVAEAMNKDEDPEEELPTDEEIENVE